MKNKLVKKGVWIVTTLLVFLLAIMELDEFWGFVDKVENRLGYQKTKGIYEMHNNIDLVKALSFKNLNDSDVIDISIKKSKLSELMEQVSLFKELGYQDDDKKKWFKAIVEMGGKSHKSKIKLHGTSSTWLKRGFLSFKVKHEKEQKYSLNYRRFNLINVQDKYMSFASAANGIASELGLISPSGRIVLLRINGIEMGLYFLVEDHKKEFFERNYGVVDYVTLSPTDKWVGTSWGHVSPHDMSSYYYEASGAKDSRSKGLARGHLELLFSAIRENDRDAVVSLIDKEYFAKFLALIYLFNDIHFITGDNLRLVYDFHRGKVYPVFRLENLPNKIENTNIVEFNKSLFNMYDYSPTHEIFKYMVKDSEIREARDRKLWELVSKKSEVRERLSKHLNNNESVLIASSFPRKRYELLIKRALENVDSNFDLIEQYLTYSNLYVVSEDKLSYVADSMVPISHTKSGFKIANQLDDSLVPVFGKNVANMPIKDCQSIQTGEFINAITGQGIEPQNMKCVNVFNGRQAENWSNALDKSNVGYRYDKANKQVVIKKGRYSINNNIVFDEGIDVILKAGTSLILSEGVSIVIKGNLTSIGSKDEPILVTAQEKQTFGVLSVRGDTVVMEHTSINGGGKDMGVVNGVKYTSQITIRGGSVRISHSTFMDSVGDDGINIKYANVHIENSLFQNNFADQIDLDYCTGVLRNNRFLADGENKDGDGVDVSGSRLSVEDSVIDNHGDKGISVGEGSYILVSGNQFDNNGKTIAIKDGSKVFLGENTYHKENSNIHMYNKKMFYPEPELATYSANLKGLKIDKKHGEILFVDNNSIAQQYEVYKNKPVPALK